MGIGDRHTTAGDMNLQFTASTRQISAKGWTYLYPFCTLLFESGHFPCTNAAAKGLGGCSMVSSSRCGKGALVDMQSMTSHKFQISAHPISSAAFSPNKKSVTVVSCYILCNFVTFTI